MAETTITCPSGLAGRIRGMKVREERILADRRLARSGGQVDELLAACWEETVDPGPYDFGDRDIDWGKVLQGDRFYALLQIRALTYGPEYAFACLASQVAATALRAGLHWSPVLGCSCQNEACRARIEWELDLGDLPVRPLSDGSRRAFLDGNRFETVLPDAGKRVWFRLLTGADERKLPQLRSEATDRSHLGIEHAAGLVRFGAEWGVHIQLRGSQGAEQGRGSREPPRGNRGRPPESAQSRFPCAAPTLLRSSMKPKPQRGDGATSRRSTSTAAGCTGRSASRARRRRTC